MYKMFFVRSITLGLTSLRVNWFTLNFFLIMFYKFIFIEITIKLNFHNFSLQ